MSVARRQALLASFINDPAVEQRVRQDPAAAAVSHGVSPAFSLWLAQLAPERVIAFRRSRVIKARRRAGPV